MRKSRITELSSLINNIGSEPMAQETSVSDSIKLQFVKLQKFGFPINTVNTIKKNKHQELGIMSNRAYQEEIGMNYRGLAGMYKVF